MTASTVVLSSSVPATPARARSFAVLQMNLCNSGMATASCYSFGKAVVEAVAKIHRYRPDLITLQEICRDDLYAGRGWGTLARAMADLYGSAHTIVEFVPAYNRDTNDWYRCTDGQPFGVALILHGHGDRMDLHRGWYASQDPSNEIRAWACITLATARLTGCTTHLSTDPDVAMRQCRELMSVLASPWVMPRVIVSADFNLTAASGSPYNVRDCAPASYDVRSDSSLQHVLFTRTLHWTDGGYESMKWTDHPALYQRFRI